MMQSWHNINTDVFKVFYKFVVYSGPATHTHEQLPYQQPPLPCCHRLAVPTNSQTLSLD